MLDLEFKFKPSKQYLIFMSSILLSSFMMMGCLPVNAWLKLTGCIFVLSYGGHILWRFGFLRGKRSILNIRRHHDGSWHLYTKYQHYQAELQGDSLVTSFVTILRFRVAKQFFPWSCIIFRDSLESELYRRLQVVLKAE